MTRRPLFAKLLIALPWVVSLAWLVRAVDGLLHADSIPDLLRLPEPEPLASFDQAPVLSVVAPACNEQDAIEATVRSLLASRGLPLEVVAVDDRSTDRTGAILDRLAAEFAPRASERRRLQVLHIEELPPGWLGKPHALARGTELTAAPYLLFTDADLLFRHDALLRALAFLREQQLDHLILASTPIMKTEGERMMIGTLQGVAAWAIRLWKIADPRARESLGVGSFSLVRREVLDAVGGWETFRLEVIEDLRLGWEIKRRHGFRQQVALGRGLLRLHWASGALGLAHNLTKNGFAMFRFRLPAAIAGLVSLSLLLFAPLAALAGPSAARWALAPFALALAMIYRRDAGQTGLPVRYALLFPAGAALLVYALARSVVLTLLRRGVAWRGTFYPLALLRENAGPLR